MKAVPRGLRNNNPMNIRDTDIKWLGEVEGNDKEFETFDSALYGIRAGALIFYNYQRKYKLNTIRKLIGRWAPPNENNTEAYIKYVCDRVQLGPETTFWLASDLQKFSDFVEAVIHMECGTQPFERHIIERAVQMATGKLL